MSSVNIARYQARHGAEVAQLHRMALPSGFLSHLGDRFLAELYHAICQDSRSGVWVAMDDHGNVAGFLSGTADVRRCYRNVLWKSSLRLIWPLLPSLWSRATMRRLGETLLYPFRSSSSGENTAHEALGLPGELLSIAVSETARGQGTGRQLIAEFELALQGWGYSGPYRVVTDQTDPRSNAFYRSVGFRAAGSFRHHDHPMSVYTRELPPETRAGAA